MTILSGKPVPVRHKPRGLVAISFVGCLLALACRQDIGLLLRDNRPKGNGVVSPVVMHVLPDDEADGVGTNTKISFVFSADMAPDSVTASTSGSTCGGSVQVSADNFATCVPMNGQPSNADSGRIFTLTPAAPLSANTLYKTRVTTAVRSADNQHLSSTYSTTTGFRTGPATDTRAPIGPQAAGFIAPFNGAASVGTNTMVLVYFLEPPSPSTMLVNTSNNQCTGSIRVSGDSFVTCVPFKGRPSLSYSGKIYSLMLSRQLEPSTTYRIGVQNSVTDLAGNAFGGYTSQFSTGTGISPTPNSVAGTTPAENTTNISINSNYQITFNRPIDPDTLRLNFSTNTCSGAVQLSMDGFNTCVPFSSRVLLSESFTDLYLFPLGSLTASFTYRFRVTAELKDSFGESVTAFTQTNGFTTVNPSSPTVEHLIAFDGSSLGSLLAPFGVSFSKVMNPATIIVNTINTSCVGGYAFQVSSDNFTTCLRMVMVTANSSNSRFFVYPALPLNPTTLYRSRLTSVAQDAIGNLNTLFTGSGITTEP
jgi:Bacterial Ig-like domain